ncbi:DUF4299 family protein [Campylobacter concisus]|uniref:DUF4299 family protein n=1 Tax=Campylobacter concisus TaxID=199 RepID=UPI000CD8748F|nr:DUF4299 family protein [Campylobacter concisus]
MSVTFKIKNKKKLLGGYAKALSEREISELVEGLFFFNSEQEEPGANELGADVMIAGVRQKSARGFELSYEDGKYIVRVCTPSGVGDWQTAILFLSKISAKTGSKIECDNEEIYDSDQILKFDYEADIMWGLEALKDAKEKNQTLYISGLERDVAFDAVMIDEIFASASPAAKFDEMMRRVQYLDAYSARENLYEDKDGNEIFGAYTLSENLPTILPYAPSPSWQAQEVLGDRKVSRWILTLVVGVDDRDAHVLGECEYGAFMANLPKEKYRFIDAANILVEPLSEEEMREIFKKANEA